MTELDKLFEDEIFVYWGISTSKSTTQDWVRRVKVEVDKLQDRHEQTVHQMLRDSIHYQKNITECVKKLEASQEALGKIFNKLTDEQQKLETTEKEYMICVEDLREACDKLEAIQRLVDKGAELVNLRYGGGVAFAVRTSLLLAVLDK